MTAKNTDPVDDECVVLPDALQSSVQGVPSLLALPAANANTSAENASSRVLEVCPSSFCCGDRTGTQYSACVLNLKPQLRG